MPRWSFSGKAWVAASQNSMGRIPSSKDKSPRDLLHLCQRICLNPIKAGLRIREGMARQHHCRGSRRSLYNPSPWYWADIKVEDWIVGVDRMVPKDRQNPKARLKWFPLRITLWDRAKTSPSWRGDLSSIRKAQWGCQLTQRGWWTGCQPIDWTKSIKVWPQRLENDLPVVRTE